MALEEKKQSLSGGRIKREMPPQKEVKKDTSLFGGFGGKPYLKREEIRESLRKEEAYKILKKPLEERVGFEKKIFSPQKFGEFIDPKEVERAYKEIKDFPTGSKEKYGFKDEGERLKTLDWLKKMMGK